MTRYRSALVVAMVLFSRGLMTGRNDILMALLRCTSADRPGVRCGFILPLPSCGGIIFHGLAGACLPTGTAQGD